MQNGKLKRLKQLHNYKEEKGITLLVLVITIIIIIILATITMNLALGDGGLLGQAEDIRDMAENSTQTEEEKRNSLAGELADLIPFQPQETPEPETGGQEFEMSYGVIEIKWLQGTTNNVSDVPNEPRTKQISNGTMELVRFDEASQEWIPGREYSYVAGTGTADNNQSKWANARVTIDGVDSYFVWIPRYAYRIVYFKDEASKNEYKNGTITEEQAIADGKLVGYSDSRGIVTAEGKRVDSVTSASNTTHTMVSEDYFMPHPAFLDGTDNGFENGEWDRELAGLWIGKYEAAKSGNTMKVQAGVSPSYMTKIGDKYDMGITYSAELESHMLKNSEWGVVAYLTESTYGRNGTELDLYDNIYTTGGGSDNAYLNNKKASSTGNEYGIYDLAGCTGEYLASYAKGNVLKEEYVEYGSSFASLDRKSDKYVTVYEADQPTKTMAFYKYGDAIYETSGWHSDNTMVGLYNYPYLTRGGNGTYTGTGIFQCGTFYRPK